jgi:predicted DNA-binding transcriptional regulator YafY
MSERGRNAKLIRVLTLGRYLEGRRTMPPFPELARTFGVAKRTVIRDIEALEAVAWPKLPPRRTNRWRADERAEC